MFLRLTDYFKNIQSDNLNQVTENNDYNRTNAELASQAEITSYLTQRYVISKIFTDTNVYSGSATYYAKNLVEYTEPTWSASTAYFTNDRIVYSGKIYQALSNNTNQTPSANPLIWQFIVDDKQLYYVSLPNSEWNKETTYTVGTQVWYENKVYTSVTNNTGVKPTTSISDWGTGTTYSITGIIPTNILSWTKGDNRNQLIVMYMVDITLYHLHSRINPRNIPALRADRYDDAIKWLKAVASGDITADLAEISPESGVSIRYGSTQKLGNYY